MNNSEVTNKIKRFEDLVAWQKARILAKGIYDVTRTGGFRHDYGLAGRIQRAAVSIMSNVAEGFERGSLGEFHQFLSTAKASCAEKARVARAGIRMTHRSQTPVTPLRCV
jgi:four helix bundle protein